MGSLCNEEYFLFPGVWNYAFAVSAFNGDVESGRGSSVIASKPTSDTPQDFKCPAQPAWCPGGGEVDVPDNPRGTGTPTDHDDPDEIEPPISTDMRIVRNSKYGGPDCKNGQYTDKLFASYGYIGDDCSNGRCLGGDCTPAGCIGPNCRDGVCIGNGCVYSGCIGPDCDSNGRCTGSRLRKSTGVEGCSRPSDTPTSTSAACEMLVVTNTWSPDNPQSAIPVLRAGGNLNRIYITGGGAKLTLTGPPPPSHSHASHPSEPPSGNPPFERNHRVIVKLEWIPSGSEIGDIDAWVLFKRMLDDPPIEVCNTRPLSTTYIYTNDIGTYLAADIGPFTAHGNSGCKYNSNSKDRISTPSCQSVPGVPGERNGEKDVHSDLGAVIKLFVEDFTAPVA